MIRILGGRFRGRKLEQPSSLASRPSSARLRKSLFSVLGERLSGRWVDLFCGVGGFGIEAIGRGAEHMHFVDVAPAALQALAANLASLRVGAEKYSISRGDARRWLERETEREGEGYAGIFCDPPYEGFDPLGLLPLGLRLVESGRARVFVLEHASSTSPDPGGDGPRIRTYSHGRAAFTLVGGESA